MSDIEDVITIVNGGTVTHWSCPLTKDELGKALVALLKLYDRNASLILLEQIDDKAFTAVTYGGGPTLADACQAFTFVRTNPAPVSDGATDKPSRNDGR